MRLSVIIPTHNPHRGRFRRTLAGLRAQALSVQEWELCIVDNASADDSVIRDEDLSWHSNARIVREPRVGLTAARQRGFAETTGEIQVLVDDDNVLAPDYLSSALDGMARHPRVGAAGGKSIAEFERDPAPWQREFLPLLALRDLGETERMSDGLRPQGAVRNQYPLFAPVGAGMVLRRVAARAWLEASRATTLSDRRGGDLSSSGDNDIVLTIMKAGWEVAYFPELVLTHLIPSGRLAPEYLARLNRGIQKSWMQVLSRHDANPWPPLDAPGAWIRKLRAWFLHQAWRSPAARIRWAGACGHFEGRVPESGSATNSN